MSNIIYSVVLPAYCEALIIEESLNKLSKALKDDKKRSKNTELIVVIANSSDKTLVLVKKNVHLFNKVTIIQPGPKVGKGRDVREGILAAKGRYSLFLDADMATPPNHIKYMFDMLEDGCDVAIGTRPLSKIHNTFMRRVRSVISNMLIRCLAVPGISDTQCGFKGFNNKAAQNLFKPLKTMAWGFDIEILARARAKKFKISELFIDDWYDPKIGKMGLVGESDIHANINTLKELLLISKNRLLRRYK